MCFRVQSLGFRVLGSGFRVLGSVFRVLDSGFRVELQWRGSSGAYRDMILWSCTRVLSPNCFGFQLPFHYPIKTLVLGGNSGNALISPEFPIMLDSRRELLANLLVQVRFLPTRHRSENQQKYKWTKSCWLQYHASHGLKYPYMDFIDRHLNGGFR